jgi:hypothetical protein
MKCLNKLELEILDHVSDKYPMIKSHLPFLQVKNREITGVGIYVNLVYRENPVEKIDILNSSLNSNEIIQMDGLKDGLNYEIDITDGRINFIEIVSNGESWDGSINNFIFIPI